jgi:hypothetical protein
MIRVSALPQTLEVAPGVAGQISVSITNTSQVIDQYSIAVFGIDPGWVTAQNEMLSLFPGETGAVVLDLRLPVDYPASVRPIAVSVSSASSPDHFELAQVELEITEATTTSVAIDPTMVTAGKSATFGLAVTNKGNAPVLARPFAVDPEDLAVFVIEPVDVLVAPGRTQIVQIAASGGRSWFGMPRARTFNVGVEAERHVETMATFIQRPRISRWMLSLLGLLCAAAVFAFVLSRTFDSVVEEVKVSDDVLNEALGTGAAGGARVPSSPSSVTGRLTSSTSDELRNGLVRSAAQTSGSGTFGIPAVQVELYALCDDDGQCDPSLPVATAASQEDGVFSLPNLGDGEYKMFLSGSGYDDEWYTDDGLGAKTFADASPIAVGVDDLVDLGELQVGAIPAAVAGSVGGDAGGATIKLVRPGVLDPDTPALVAEVVVAPDGSFEMPPVPSPADYQMIVEKPGFATVTRDVTLAPGETLDNIGIVMTPADGRVEGRVVSSDGTALGGISIVATDGSYTVETVSYTEGDVGGFVLRNLSSPGRFTVTASAPGYVSESQSVVLEPSQTIGTPLSMQLVPNTGRIEGFVTREAVPTGDVVVTISGGDVEQTTRPISASGVAAGQYLFQGLPAPATYTLTFSGGGSLPQVRVAVIDPFVNQGITVVPTVDLRVSNRRLSGTVYELETPLSGADVTLTNGTTVWRTVSADESTSPEAADGGLGSFAFSGVPPDVYTLTATRVGSTDTVVLVTVEAGIDLAPVILRLAPQASITGTVTNGEECALVARLFLFENFGKEWEQEVDVDLQTGSYRFVAVEAPQDYLIAISTTNSDSALGTTSASSIPSLDVSVPLIDLGATLCAPSGGGTS